MHIRIPSPAKAYYTNLNAYVSVLSWNGNHFKMKTNKFGHLVYFHFQLKCSSIIYE